MKCTQQSTRYVCITLYFCLSTQGWAYVPHSDLVSIILSAYRAHLSHALAVSYDRFCERKLVSLSALHNKHTVNEAMFLKTDGNDSNHVHKCKLYKWVELV